MKRMINAFFLSQAVERVQKGGTVYAVAIKKNNFPFDSFYFGSFTDAYNFATNYLSNIKFGNLVKFDSIKIYRFKEDALIFDGDNYDFDVEKAFESMTLLAWNDDENVKSERTES